MSTTQQSASITLTLTPSAAGKVKEFIAAEQVPAETGGLRMSVLPGGCSGFKYGLSVEDEPMEDDLILDASGVRVFVDPFSAQYLNGVEVDYVTTMQSSGFAFKNPNATGGCGCGSSFTA
jgi:iron-sulfur cluster assembly accessory protein